MNQISSREKLLSEGMRIVRARGFHRTGIREIAGAAGVSQGCFSSSFGSKEAFGLELIELYASERHRLVALSLRNDALGAKERLKLFFDLLVEQIKHEGIAQGCLLGHFCSEAGGHGESIRLRVEQLLAQQKNAISYCLRAGIQAREFSPRLQCDELASFAVASLQGATLLAKLHRDTSPISNFANVYLAMLCAL